MESCFQSLLFIWMQLEGGRVEEKYVEDGAMMKKGQPILRLSNTDLELSLVNQETSVYNLLTQMQILAKCGTAKYDHAS